MALGLSPEQIIEKEKHPLLIKDPRWLRVAIEDLSVVQNGYAFSSKYFNREKGLPLIRIRDIQSSKTENLYSGPYEDDFIVSKNDILIGMDGDFKASKWPGNKGLLNQRVCRLRFYSKSYDKRFFFICLQPYLNAIHEETSSVTVKHLSSKTIKEIPIPLPPLPEQRAIVEKIEKLFSDLENGIANLKKAQAQLKVFRQAVLKKAFEGELTKEWRAKQTDLPSAEELLEDIKTERENHYQQQLTDWEEEVKVWEENGKEGKKPRKPNSIKRLSVLSKDEVDELPTLDSSWKWIKVDWIAFYERNSIKAGPFGSSLKKIFYVENGYKVYGQEQVISGDHNLGDYYISKDRFKKLESCKVQPNDILISLVGTVGKVLILPENCEKGIINPRLVKITTNKFYSPLFFKYYFESAFLKSLYKHKNHGTTMDVLNLGIIKDLPFPICSVEEQHQIVQEIESRLSVCDQVEKDIAECLEKAEALRQSILKKAFEGNLLTEAELQACRNEPDWEPASVLLDKIKAEKKIKN